MDCCHVNQASYSYSYSDIDDGDGEGSDSYASYRAVTGDGYSSSEEDDDNHDEKGFCDDDTSSEVTEKCVLLGGLSEATYLTPLSGQTMVCFFNFSFNTRFYCSLFHYVCFCVPIYLSYLLVVVNEKHTLFIHSICVFAVGSVYFHSKLEMVPYIFHVKVPVDQ